MKRFNVLYVGLMSFFVVFGVRGMDLAKSALGQPPQKANITSTKVIPMDLVDNLRNLTIEYQSQLPGSMERVHLSHKIKTILNKEKGKNALTISQLLSENKSFIKAVKSITKLFFPQINKIVMRDFKQGLDTLYYQKNPSALCPDLVNNITLMYKKKTKKLDNDIFDSTKNLLTIFDKIYENHKEKQKIINYLTAQIEKIPTSVENPNKTTSLIYKITSLIQVVCDANIAIIAENIKNNTHISISAKIIILKALEKLPKTLISESQKDDISNQIRKLKNRKRLNELEKLLNLETKKTPSQRTLENLIKYKNQLTEYLELTSANVAETEAQNVLEQVSRHIDLLTKKRSNDPFSTTEEVQISTKELDEPFSMINWEGVPGASATETPQIYSEVTKAPMVSSLEKIKLLPYPFSNDQSLIASSCDAINRAIVMNQIEGKKLLKQTIDTFRTEINPYTLFNRNTTSERLAEDYFAKPDDLKKAMQRAYRNKFSGYICHSIPFFLRQISEYQAKEDDISQKLLEATRADLLAFIQEQSLTNQLLNNSTALRQDIISRPLNPETMQAYLLLLNAACRFYPELAPEIKTPQPKKTQTKTKPQFNNIVNDTINDILNAYNEERTQGISLDLLFTTTIKKLNELASVGPLLLESSQVTGISDDQLEMYKIKIEFLKQNIELENIVKQKLEKILENISTRLEASKIQSGATPPTTPQMSMPPSPESATVPSDKPTKGLSSLLDEPDEYTEDANKLPWESLVTKLKEITAKIANQPIDELKKTIVDLQVYLPTSFTAMSRIVTQGKSDIYKNIIQTLFNCVEKLAEKEQLALQQQTNIDPNYFKNISAQIRLFESLLGIEKDQENLKLIKNIISLYHGMINTGIQKIREIKDSSERKNTIDSYLGNDDILKPYLLNEESYERISTTLTNDYRKTAHELIAKDYSSSSLEELGENLNKMHEIKSSGQVNELNSELETKILALSAQLLQQTKDFINQTQLNENDVLGLDHFKKLSQNITGLNSNIHGDTDNEIVQLYWDKLANDIKLLIDQIKNKRGIFQYLKKRDNIEQIVRSYLNDKNEILQPFLARVLSEIKDDTLPLETNPEQTSQPTPPAPTVAINPAEKPAPQPNIIWRTLSGMWSGITSLWNSIVSYFTYVN